MTIRQGFMIENGKMRIATFNTELHAGWFDAPDKAERAANPPKPEPPKIDPRFIPRPTLKLKRAK